MKKTLLYLCTALYVAAALALLFRNRSEDSEKGPLSSGPNVPEPASTFRPPQIHFRNVTEQAGIHFQHEAGEYGALLFPEINGPGCGFFDYDNDGDADIFLVNSGQWPHRESDPTRPTVVHALYRNEGGGRFVDVGKEMGLVGRSYGQGVCFGDIDNDGFEDIYLTCVGRNILFHNERGERFVDRTSEAGLECPEWSVSAAFLDYDRDGFLDLFVTNYVKWSLEVEAGIKALREFYIQKGEERIRLSKKMPLGTPTNNPSLRDMLAYGNPALYDGTHCSLYRNLDGRHFRDTSRESGIHRTERGGKPASKALGVGVCDYDEDGWADIAVANDGVPNFLFKNLGNGSFRDMGSEVGISTNLSGQSRAGMGISWGDYRNDHSIAMAVGNFATEILGLYLSRDAKRSVFVDVAMVEGVAAPSRPGVTWGLFFFDYDLDGRLDLFTVNGHIHETEARVHNIPYYQKAVLYWNRGPLQGGSFVPVTAEEGGEDLFTPMVGRGAAFADADGDGDLDILVVTNMGPAYLFRNEAVTRGNFLRIQLVGVQSNRSAIGAKVRVRTGKIWQRREVSSGGSYASQSELILTFGLGSHTAAEEAEVFWPSGLTQTFKNLPAGKTLRIVEGKP